MLIKTKADIPYSEITPDPWYLRRREFLRLGAGLAGAIAGGALAACADDAFNASSAAAPAEPPTPVPNVTKKMVTTTEPLNKFEEITGYNNYYEFGLRKSDPAKYAGQLKTSPWTVKI